MNHSRKPTEQTVKVRRNGHVQEISARKLVPGDIDLTTHLHSNEATVQTQKKPPPLLQEQPALGLLLTGATLCNDALLEPDVQNPQQFHTIGDPTEGALIISAARLGLWKANLDHAFPRVAEMPFDSERKRMTTVHHNLTAPEVPACLPRFTLPYLMFTKGAIASLLECSSQVWVDGQPQPLDHHWRRRILTINDELATKGMRVLGVAFRPLEHLLSHSDDAMLSAVQHSK